MAVNPAQGDHTITEASDNDTEAKIKNLEREVDLIKTSIKRLLMDIRERMNELENPFTITQQGSGGDPNASSTRRPREDSEETKRAALESKEASLNARETEMNRSQERYPTSQQSAPRIVQTPQQSMIVDDRRLMDEQLLAQFKAQLMATKPAPSIQNILHQPSEKLQLQKVYKLFKWTDHAVRKFGNDRLEIMLQSFNKMGHISKDASDEIREIARLMPASLGEEHEVGPDEYVSELYTLNRIVTPEDTSLDRDMIEVMMEQRSQPTKVEVPLPAKIEFPKIPEKEKRPSKNQDLEEDWMNLPDRI
ncbi:MAG: hypothetical protein ABR887_01445 [Methanoregulaceae archaeon]|jgi:archaellum component FlaD/FlaE